MTIHGKIVHGIGEAGKTGWLYLLDRLSGKPIFPIPERPVPQDPHQKTWATQPIPSNPAVSSQILSVAQVASVSKLAVAIAGHAVPLIIAKQMFTPYEKTMTVTPEGPAGGVNWPPSSYSPRLHMFYVCSQDGVSGYTAGVLKPNVRVPGRAQEHVVGSIETLGNAFENVGAISAIDYSGSTVTAGNLLFVGRNHGELQAYDAADGKLLWQFQTGAGANSVATIFRRANGHESIALYAGGNALAASAYGDNLWLFSLDGTLGPAPAPGMGQGIQHAGTSSGRPLVANVGDGAVVFSANCSACHGAAGAGGNGGPNLTTIPTAKRLPAVVNQIMKGGGGMPAFQASLTRQQIADVSDYVVTKITRAK